MTIRLTPAKVKQWRNGADGFWQWVEDVKPRIPSSRGGFEIFRSTEGQKRAVTEALTRNEDGSWMFGTIVLCWPRRHSKTIMNALLVLWRFTCWQTQNIKVLANSERQVTSTAFKTAKGIIRNTPALLEIIGKQNIRRYRITHPGLQSEIEAIAQNESAAYGEKISIAWITELHASKDDAVLQVLASSVGDSADGWVLIDSTTDAVGGPLHHLEQLAESGEDPTVYFSRIEYRDLAEAVEKAPTWFKPGWLESRAKQMLPAVFGSQHLNQRSAAVNSLFREEDIKGCLDGYRVPVTRASLAAMMAERKHVTGGGLDRALSFSLHGDKTIWTSICKAAGDDDGEAEYWVLNQVDIPFSQGRGIKKAIAKDHEAYRLENVCIEQYQSQDILAWTQDAKIPCELVHG